MCHRRRRSDLEDHVVVPFDGMMRRMLKRTFEQKRSLLGVRGREKLGEGEGCGQLKLQMLLVLLFKVPMCARGSYLGLCAFPRT